MRFVEDYFSEDEKIQLVEAIQKAEQETSGEIRIFFERECKGETPYERGLECFSYLEMYRTKERNGVLFYIALQDHKFAIIADEGIHQNVPEGFWNEIATEMQRKMKQQSVIKGLVYGIHKAGEQLSAYFPLGEKDRNELSNELVFGNEEE